MRYCCCLQRKSKKWWERTLSQLDTRCLSLEISYTCRRLLNSCISFIISPCTHNSEQGTWLAKSFNYLRNGIVDTTDEALFNSQLKHLKQNKVMSFSTGIKDCFPANWQWWENSCWGLQRLCILWNAVQWKRSKQRNNTSHLVSHCIFGLTTKQEKQDWKWLEWQIQSFYWNFLWPAKS